MTNQNFPTGAMRDTAEGKPRISLIPPDFILHLAQHMTKHTNSGRYPPDNWKKGMPIHRMYDSLGRHILLWMDNDQNEDHMIAAAWNAMAIWWTERKILQGELPEILLTAGPHKKYEIVEYEAWEKKQEAAQPEDEKIGLINQVVELYLKEYVSLGEYTLIRAGMDIYEIHQTGKNGRIAVTNNLEQGKRWLIEYYKASQLVKP